MPRRDHVGIQLHESHIERGLTITAPQPISPSEFWIFCLANPDLRVERNARGQIVVAPLTGWNTAKRELIAATELDGWATRKKCGEVGGPTSPFQLPSGAVLTPDASWISRARTAHLTETQRLRFLPAVPEFVIEVLSPSDNRRKALAKMHDWILEGVDLAWLIDPGKKTVYVFRKRQPEPERIIDADSIQGEGPLATFKLNLRPIWKGRA